MTECNQLLLILYQFLLTPKHVFRRIEMRPTHVCCLLTSILSWGILCALSTDPSNLKTTLVYLIIHVLEAIFPKEFYTTPRVLSESFYHLFEMLIIGFVLMTTSTMLKAMLYNSCLNLFILIWCEIISMFWRANANLKAQFLLHWKHYSKGIPSDLLIFFIEAKMLILIFIVMFDLDPNIPFPAM